MSELFPPYKRPDNERDQIEDVVAEANADRYWADHDAAEQLTPDAEHEQPPEQEK